MGFSTFVGISRNPSASISALHFHSDVFTRELHLHKTSLSVTTHESTAVCTVTFRQSSSSRAVVLRY